jgi:hypothetical protein
MDIVQELNRLLENGEEEALRQQFRTVVTRYPTSVTIG